ncbi:MAG: RHS repeat protein [Verrucomicrobia bacterium]|nr:RHS repeat protein [Verrucomicrobiota bacterium]MBS0646452.1 RHS repeat protein [Verrucomicrobiota bacterium]
MKQKQLLLFFLVLMNVLLAKERCDFFDLEVSKEHILDQRQNYFLTSTDYKINPKVNPITGEYCEEEVDLVIAGCQPLSVRRFYNSSSPYDSRYANWRYNPESFFVANLEWGGQEIFAAIGDIDGSICLLKSSNNQACEFDFQTPANFTISSSDGSSHPINTKISYWRKGDPKDKKRFQYIGTITDGSGRKRTFASPMHRWTNDVVYTEKKGSWLKGGSEKTWRVLPNTWTPYHIPVIEEKLPNGNILCYGYTQWKEEKQNFPLPQLLSSITAYNADKTQILGCIHFHYPRTKHEEIAGIQITGSDGRSSFMQHQKIGKSPIKLAAAQRAGQPITSYASHNTVLNTVAKPEGRVITTNYNSEGKVSSQYAPVGPNGELCSIGCYEYHDNLTVFYDAENNKIHYRYDENKRLTSIETFLGNVLYRIDRFAWDFATGNLLKKTVEDDIGSAIHITEYQYDKNQNPVLEKIGDGKEWRIIKRTYSDDGRNLKLTETDREDKLICYAYLPNSALVASEFIYENNEIKKRTFHFYDNCAIRIKTIIDDGITDNPNNLQGVHYRVITYITPKKSLPCFGLPEIIEEKTIDSSGNEILLHKTILAYTPYGKILQEEHFDANNTHHHTIYNVYNDQECLISTTDPLGNKTEFGYDANHNLTSIMGPKPGQYKEISYDQANRPIRIADWQMDGTILVLEKKYDKLGRLIEEIDACKNSTYFNYDAIGRIVSIHYPDGAIEQKEYNILGQITKERDPLGYTTEKEYNVYGQVTSIHRPDGSVENSTYNSTGTLKSHTDKNGCTILYAYDIFNHLIESTYIIDDKILKKTQATYTPFCKLTDTDSEGNTTHYTYDFRGKKTLEITDAKKTYFIYDSSGSLAQTDCEYFQQIEHHNKAGHLISKQIICDAIQFQEKYAYDEASNLIHRITSHGVFETLYNTFGKSLLETNPLGYKTEHTYQFTDNYREITIDANHIQTTRVYDNRGREIACIKTNSQGEMLAKSESLYDYNGNLIALTHYIFNSTSFIKTVTHRWEYGPMGRLERFIEADEKQTQHFYDEKGRLKTTIKPSGIQFHHEYDSIGRLTRYFSSDFDYHYSYDRNDHLLSVYDSFTKSTTTRVYNSFGAVKQEVIATGLKFFNIFDNQGRRIKLTLPDNSEIDYVYQGFFLHHVTRKGNTFTYQTRDLEGYPVELELPANTGNLIITRDGLSRIATFRSPVYTSMFSKNAYDPVGNLLSYQYEDPLGSVKCNYVYDQLNQLISEGGCTYLFDSINNRLEKNNTPHIVNNFCQILADGNTNYEYDLDGNLLFDGQWRYTYDTQDHLIALENSKTRIEYTYDPFHRRLSKTVFTNSQRIRNERYLWDGEHEIGSIDENGKILQLRVLGEGFGAEIGAAVLYELNNKSYVPIHDYNGNLVVLIDIKTQKPVEICRYSAFGEELTSNSISPWRFASKRIEEENGLIFFGRRYYLPALGRWITQDPQGFDDGPNLYAYLSNCPLIFTDPYGLMRYGANSQFSHYDFLGGLGGAMRFLGLDAPRNYSHFEDSFSNKSRTYSLNHDFEFSFSEPPIGAYLFGNGVGNEWSDLGKKAQRLSIYTGYNIRGVYNATHSLPIDVHEAFINLNSHTMTPPVYLYHQEWNRYFDNDKTGAPLWQSCHSQGAAQVRNALETYPQDRRERIIVAAFAPLAYISPKLCMKVNHYVCPSDRIPYIDRSGKRACEDTITYVPKMSNCRQSCHEFLNPIYLPYIEKEIQNYQKILKNYVR